MQVEKIKYKNSLNPEISKNSKNVLVLVFDEVEEIEALSTVDILQRAYANVCVASLSGSTKVLGRSSIEFFADEIFENVKNCIFDCVVLAGGAGVKNYLQDENLLSFLKKHHLQNKLLCAICAAPLIFEKAQILGDKYTCHFSVKDILKNALNQKVVQNKNIISSQGAGTSIEFSLKIVENLFSIQKTKDIAYSICKKL